jgi:hypothetical protein
VLARLVSVGIKPNIQRIDSTKDKAQFGARMAALDLDYPLTTDADPFGESRLVEL